MSVLILNEDGTRIVGLLRKEACYCRFTPADAHGRISKILYANWRKSISSQSDIEEIDLLDQTSPRRDLQDKLAKTSPLGASSTNNSKCLSSLSLAVFLQLTLPIEVVKRILLIASEAAPSLCIYVEVLKVFRISSYALVVVKRIS